MEPSLPDDDFDFAAKRDDLHKGNSPRSSKVLNRLLVSQNVFMKDVKNIDIERLLEHFLSRSSYRPSTSYPHPTPYNPHQVSAVNILH